MFEQNIVSFTGEHHANYRNWGSLQLGHKPLNYKKVLKWSQWAACPFSLRWTVFSCCFMDYCLFFFTKTRGVRGFYTSYAAGTQWNFILIHGNNNHARWESFNQCSTALFTSFFPPFWSYWKEKSFTCRYICPASQPSRPFYLQVELLRDARYQE